MSPKKAYFIGIGGIGMSALAQLLHHDGWNVSGSDREESPTTELLKEKGMSVRIGQNAENVPADADMVIYTEAAWEDNAERMRAAELGLPQKSYFEMLGEVSKGKRTIAIAGTHGKTTTTAMAARILSDAGVSPSAVIGSIVKDFKSNYLSGTSEWLVVEACEYKGDFLTLAPEVLVVTNIEWDHTDYYPNLEAVQESFLALMKKAAVIVTNPKDKNIAPLLSGLSAKVIDYTQEPAYELALPGDFNQMNARAAVAAARIATPKITDKTIRTALSKFEGTWRRFDYKGKTKRGALVYDDYAHHPTAIQKTLAEFKKKPHGTLYVAFHPHLFSRTRDLLAGFAKAFKDADRVLIAPIYAAREEDDGTMSNSILARKIEENGTDAKAADFTEIRRYFETEPGEGDIVVTMGAGDIYKVADELVAN
ncbi:MAG TPA: Mur ligase domain-containing protein [Candidatus Paceibacterota bacterium]|nr:Mur ligase domain-containing protein [Candidatus Paceibacterota bacterium]